MGTAEERYVRSSRPTKYQKWPREKSLDLSLVTLEDKKSLQVVEELPDLRRIDVKLATLSHSCLRFNDLT